MQVFAFKGLSHSFPLRLRLLFHSIPFGVPVLHRKLGANQGDRQSAQAGHGRKKIPFIIEFTVHKKRHDTLSLNSVHGVPLDFTELNECKLMD